MSQNIEVASLPARADNGYILVNVGYSDYWLVPLEDGLKIVEGLRKAKKFEEKYQEPPKVYTLPPVTFKYITQEQYDAWNVQELFTV